MSSDVLNGMAHGRVTIMRAVETEIVVKKSRFIGNASPAASELEANSFIKKIRSKYSDASHNVFAYYLNGGAAAKCSDDGEPQGSSGYPVLNVIKMSGITDVCIVVSRYFGGILLGTGGLARAYSEAARNAVSEAGFAVYEKYTVAEAFLGYSDYQKLTTVFRNSGVDEENAEFGELVRVAVAFKEGRYGEVKKMVADVSQGSADINIIRTEERLTPIDFNK